MSDALGAHILGELRMKAVVPVATLVLLGGLSSFAQAPVSAPSPAPGARAVIADGTGKTVGEAAFWETTRGVLVRLDLRDVPAGPHGLHIHTVGKCEGPAFQTAGGHFETSGHEHGFLNPKGAHLGDLPNITVPASKQLSVEDLLSGATLQAGANSLLDADGSAIIVHAGKDDYTTNPAGNAGDRFACGAITASK
jgi:Cu-Zn family superoxide dismutase